MSSVGQKGFTTVRWSFAGQEGLHFVSRFMVISRVQDFVFRQNAPRSSIGRLGEVNDHIWSGYGRIFREVQNFGAKTPNLNHVQTRVPSGVPFFPKFLRDEFLLKFQPEWRVLKPAL